MSPTPRTYVSTFMGQDADAAHNLSSPWSPAASDPPGFHRPPVKSPAPNQYRSSPASSPLAPSAITYGEGKHRGVGLGEEK